MEQFQTFEGSRHTVISHATKAGGTTKIGTALGTGYLLGVFVSKVPTVVSIGVPSIEIRDGDGSLIVPSFTPQAAGQYAFPTQFRGELQVIIKGAVQCTVFWA